MTTALSKVKIFLEQKEVAFLSPNKICENMNFSTVHLYKFKFSQILLGDKNTTYLCSKIISTLPLGNQTGLTIYQLNLLYSLKDSPD